MLYITLRQYEYIVAVADAGSLTKAASVLNVSQPSLSVAITRVEGILNASLFRRGKGALIEITPAGHRVISKARKVLETATKAEQKHETSVTFFLGCFEDLAPWHLAPALKQLTSEFPEMNFHGKEGRLANLAKDLAEGRVDLAITYDIGFSGSFERFKIGEISPVVFLSEGHPLAENLSIELDDLIDYPLLLSSEELSERFVRGLFDRMQLFPTVRQTVTSLEMMRSLAAHGMGVGISYSKPPSEISYDGSTLVTIPVTTPAATTDINLIWSGLRDPDPQFEHILRVLARTHTSSI